MDLNSDFQKLQVSLIITRRAVECSLQAQRVIRDVSRASWKSEILYNSAFFCKRKCKINLNLIAQKI